ncbi:MAG: PQQ-binding-like beta-propeller repeat protein [Candidatus Fermentibacteraceae bacterium]|nr:PQQ-binding-like beta-propeller repeat protein [Candidatus Fermentibacteraceae bacterium]MBN2608396.1 PQQ-binding-like beta-propeller repeat protein [Candidatus Fermentibacteraceae bacterium]
MYFLLMVLAAGAPDTLWANVTSGGVYSTVEVGDLDGDGIPDVVSGVNFWDAQPTLWCISGADGATIWTSDQYKGIYQDEGLTGVQDLNGDGYRDILLATPGGYAPPGRCLILVSGYDGSLIWQWSAYETMPSGAGWGYSCCVMDDQTGDELPECIGGFGSTGSANTSAAACLDGTNGDILWTRTVSDAVEDVLAVPDVNQDGIQEVVLGIGGNSYTDYTIELLDGSDGSLIWSRMGGGDVMCVDALDREDTLPWVVSSSFDGEARCYDLGGALIWERDLGGMLLDVESGPDLNSDGISEVALAGDNAGTMCLDGATGNTLWSYPSGSNTWSVAWTDSVYTGGVFVPCIAGGSVNGYRITLNDAVTGDLLWEQSFTERVYNVSSFILDGVSPSSIVFAGLQDQQPQPFHAWAFLSSVETTVGEGQVQAYGGRMLRGNPVSGIALLTPPEGEWECCVYDLSGRLVWTDMIKGVTSIDVSAWSAGCYLLVASRGDIDIRESLTVIH